ncbi:MAG: LacI family DNA-binding transcriptional regulator [Bacteroidales bacterium]|nr:LacI family DNA-binding transcriptional regulator [Bacteroidales bacterium]
MKKFRNKDLATRLGVSGTLVSLVLNNKDYQQGIRKETQEKVLSLARQMGYFESLGERHEISPVEEKPGILGMLVPSLNDPFVIQIAPYLQKAFSSIGVGFSIITKESDDVRYDRLVGAFKKFYSGMILLGDAADDSTIRTLKATDYPFILLERHVRSLRLNTVITDSGAGASLVINHIDKLGYRNVLIIADNKPSGLDTPDISDLVDAIAQKTSMNKPVIIELEKQSSPDEINPVQFEKFLRPPYRADVMIIMTARQVYPIMKFLRTKNIRIPQDIAVISMEEGVGFDLMYSPVTCLRKPLANLSVKVVNMIWSEVKNSGKGKFKRQVNITPELVVRASCGTI